MNPTEQIKKDAEKWENTLSAENLVEKHTKKIVNSESEEKILYIPTPNFTDCATAGSQLPVNMANEAISILSRYRSEFDFVDFIKEKLNYNTKVAVCMAFFSEQIDALVLAIKQFEDGKALILGDMAGIGKGRVCAGVLRYAYQHKLIPVFVTEKENLFSDIFRDIMGIGGFGSSGGNDIKPIPFIMIPRHRTRLKDESGATIRTVTTNAILDDNDNVLYEPITKNKIDKLIKDNGDFPFKKKSTDIDDFNCVFLTYNVISKTKGVSGNAKRYFLTEIAPKSIFIFDECHNASGLSTLGDWCKQYVAEAKGAMFSSATYAKNPQAYPLYIIKTAMAEAQIDLASIEKAIEVGGENVSEYISSVLVKEGQMIRRDRDFSGCGMCTIYEGYDKNAEESQIIKDRIYETFDKSVSGFRRIYNYIRQRAFVDAIKGAVLRKAEELQLDLASQGDYIEARGKERLRADFIRDNRGKYVIQSYQANTLGATTKFHFAETLFLAIKANFTAEAIIKELKTEVEQENFDGSKKKTNRKPVVAIRATGEGIYKKLGLKKGDTILNDFSEYSKAIVSGVMRGNVVFRKVNADVFTTKAEMELEGKTHTEEDGVYEIDNSDLPDNGEKLNEYVSEVMASSTGIPLSTIDYLVDRIESEIRAGWDNKYRSGNYKVGEVTGRELALRKNRTDDSWTVVANEREKSVKSSFNQFNKGIIDVLIINASGSTGGSIHSSESFIDKRQRIMFLLQLELDVNTEVQKRGRVNRTGQVNFPAYAYVLSQVPSEIRKYLSLKKKMRKLDANVSANQVQNADMTAVKTDKGENIEDIFNIYGEEAFNIFINDDDNIQFTSIYNTMMQNFATKLYQDEYVQDGEKTKDFLFPFSRELEVYECSIQEGFYNAMNVIYKSVVADKNELDEYHLELETEDLKASLRTRIVKQINNGYTEFSKPLFMEDKYCLERRRLWSKEKVDSEITKMATKFYQRKDEFTNTTKFHNDLLDDFEIVYAEYVQFQKDRYTDLHKPIRKDFSSKADYQDKVIEYDNGLAELSAKYNAEHDVIRVMLSWFKPNRNIMYPIVSYDEKGEPLSTVIREGKFIGYSFKGTSEYNKYSKGAIHFKFAFITSGDGLSPSVELNINRHKSMLEQIKSKTNETFVIRNNEKVGKSYMDYVTERLDKWTVNANLRSTVRFLSGNILSGIQMANAMKGAGEIVRWSMVRHTNSDSTISTGVRLVYGVDGFIPLSSGSDQSISETIQVAITNPEIVTYLKQTPADYRFYVSVNVLRSNNVEPVQNANNDVNIKGLIVIEKSDKKENDVFVKFYQGNPFRKTKNESGELATPIIPTLNSYYGNNPIFFAPFLNDYTPIVTRVYDKNRNPFEIFNDKVFKKTNGRKYIDGFSKIYEFKNIDTDKGANDLKRFFNLMYEEQMLSLDFPLSINDYYNITFKGDVPESEYSKKEKDKEKQIVKIFEGENYEYKLEVDFDSKYELNLPPSFKGFVKGKNSFDKGVVNLGQPMLPTFAKAYSIYPINFSNEDTVKLLLSIYKTDDREVFIRDLTNMSEKGDSFSEIGDYVSTSIRKRSVSDLKYIFGNMRINDIGELLKTYALQGDMQKLEFEVVAESETEIPKPKKRKTEITIEDAEKFINYMLF